MKNLNALGYIQGAIYPNSHNLQPVSQTISDLQSSGFETVILGLAHIGCDHGIARDQLLGDLYLNDALILSQGRYVGEASWLIDMDSLIGGSVRNVGLSIGGDGSFAQDFQTVKRIYESNAGSFEGTNLEQSFKQLKRRVPAISVVDMDCEETYDLPSFIAFCRMQIDLGYSISFCPFEKPGFWVQSLCALEASNPGSVRQCNLQCYNGGTGNEPSDWSARIKDALPSFDTDGFINTGYWPRFVDYFHGNPICWEGDSAKQVQALMQDHADNPEVGGGFIWRLDQVLDYNANQSIIPDPDFGAENGSLAAYANAIKNGL